ncbi:MAG: NAD-dependent epimerase/dehydratase family protein [Syntrophales bacterium]|nr:NAD-dependent epimerase/dehydratase family protein [Syntrophales bacterium]MDD5641330.1 NAD-dependent epimerase/dehydratase family protein [Syntrophales bacterium]
MRALVTGASGFIGSNLVDRLLAEGAAVKCLVRRGSNLKWLKNLPVTLVTGDFHDVASLAPAVADAEVVFHVAGATRARNRAAFFRGNFEATRNLLLACEQYGPPDQKFVFISSLSAAGPSKGAPLTEEHEPNPVSAYGASKLAAEKAVLEFSQKRPVTIIRPPAVYGPRDRDTFLLLKSIHRGLHVIPGGPGQQVSLVHVHDLVTGILLAAASPRSQGRIYFISGEGHHDWRTIGAYAGRVLDKRFRTLHVPWWLMRLVALGGSLTSQFTATPTLMSLDKLKDMRQAQWLCSHARAQAEIGFQPSLDLLTGLAGAAAWYKAAGWLRPQIKKG